jgi:hypothetical protein
VSENADVRALISKTMTFSAPFIGNERKGRTIIMKWVQEGNRWVLRDGDVLVADVRQTADEEWDWGVYANSMLVICSDQPEIDAKTAMDAAEKWLGQRKAD